MIDDDGRSMDLLEASGEADRDEELLMRFQRAMSVSENDDSDFGGDV